MEIIANANIPLHTSALIWVILQDSPFIFNPKIVLYFQKESPGRDNGYQMVNMDATDGKKPRELSPFLAAAEAGHLMALGKALDKGASIFEVTPYEETALHLAANQGNSQLQLDIGRRKV